MQRTQGPPLPTGRLRRAGVLLRLRHVGARRVARAAQASPLRADGSRVAGDLNWTAACLCGAIVVSYVLVYTPMKLTSPLNTLVGAIPGGLPPVVGHAAIVGELALPQLVLFAILFCWQIPHFPAIAWRYREDYARGRHAHASCRRSDRPPPGDRDGALCRVSRHREHGAVRDAHGRRPLRRDRRAARHAVLHVPTIFAALTRSDIAMR
jgi:hypothetical protein